MKKPIGNPKGPTEVGPISDAIRKLGAERRGEKPKKSKAVADIPGDHSGLSGWMDVIAKQEERNRIAQLRKVRIMRKGLKDQIAKLKDYDDEELVDNMVLMSGKRFGWDKSENEIWAKLYLAAKKEVLKRMAPYSKEQRRIKAYRSMPQS